MTTIIFDKQGKVEQAQRNPHTLVGVDICPAHIIKVWAAVSQFIKQQFCLGHGVRIPGFATITYKVFQTDVSQHKAIVDKIPLILLSENLVKSYALIAKRPVFNLDIPETPLNYSAIACMVGLPRATVETCVDEVVQAFVRSLACANDIEFHFPNIGSLDIKCRQVSPRFSRQFKCHFGFGEEIIQDKRCPTF